MATWIVKLPDIGEGVAEAEIVAWHVQVGDIIREDQPVAEIMTDKATVEIPSPGSGTVIALGAEVGTRLAVGAELLRLDVPDKPSAPPPRADAAGEEPRAEALPQERAPALPPTADAKEIVTPPAARPLAAPAVRDRARKAGVDLGQLRGSGPSGRVLHEDLDAWMMRGRAQVGHLPAREARTGVEEIAVTGLRRRIAERMAEASRRVAHFSYVEEVDVTALEELRAALNAGATEGEPRLTLLPFLIRAVVLAVADFPQMNALYDDEAQVIRRHAAVHVGIATQTAVGLMVPVMRHAEARGLHDCAAELRRLTKAARDGSATREQLSGSTITITSLGVLGGIASTPLINLPEVAIIGVNRIAVRPVWRDGSFVPRRMMNLSSSFDHRVVDGHDAAAFIQRIKGLSEMPATLFLEPI